MTKNVKIAAVGIGAILVWWFFLRKKSAAPTVVGPTGDVILGTPTVMGGAATSGGTDYNTPSTGVDAVTSA